MKARVLVSIPAWNEARNLPEVVGELRRYREVRAEWQRVVTELRTRGVAWARIGEALGMTRQSAWERFSGED